jgi:hypothetical protein
MDAFYNFVLVKLNATWAIEALVPWVEGGGVRVVGGNMSRSIVPSRANGAGVVLNISTEVQRAGQMGLRLSRLTTGQRSTPIIIKGVAWNAAT